MNRVEHYLTRILENPGCFVRIVKLKYRQDDKRSNRDERTDTVNQIKLALNLMNMSYVAVDNKIMICNKEDLASREALANLLKGTGKIRNGQRYYAAISTSP